FRRYNPQASPRDANRLLWPARNTLWRDVVPTTSFGFDGPFLVPDRDGASSAFHALVRATLAHFRSENTIPTDQIIRYPEVSGPVYYTFTFAAFAEERYPDVLREYFRFCKAYKNRTGYRS